MLRRVLHGYKQMTSPVLDASMTFKRLLICLLNASLFNDIASKKPLERNSRY